MTQGNKAQSTNKRILLTGMSGVGKSSILETLEKLGYRTVDTDENDWITHIADGERIWREDKMEALLLSKEISKGLVVSGTVINQGEFYDKFDHVILLTAPIEVIRQRLKNRTNNPYGKSPEEFAEVIENKNSIEPLLRKGADIEIDTNRPFSEVIDLITEILDD